jgi:putative acetyltransferase
LGEPLIGLVGSPSFYARLGFVPASDLGIQPPDPAWEDYFQIRSLSKHRPEINGRFVYAVPFNWV